jgi:hypothetical protein
MGWGVDWIDLLQNRDQWRALVKTVMNLRVTENIGKFLMGCTTRSFSRNAQMNVVNELQSTKGDLILVETVQRPPQHLAGGVIRESAGRGDAPHHSWDFLA